MSDALILGAAADQQNPLLAAAMAGSSCFQYMAGITAGGGEGVVDDCRAQVNVWAAWLAGEGGIGGGGGEEVAEVEEQLGGGGRGGSRRPSMKIRRLRAEQVRALDASFAHDAKLTAERKEELARQVGLQPRQVAIWFQNRKQRSKMKQLQLDFSALSSDYHSLLADTHRLKAKVAQLTKELEHAKRGKLQIEGLAPKQHFLLDALKGEHELKGVPPFITSESTPDEMMTIMSRAQQSSPSHSDYSVVVDSENPNSRNQKDASAYNDSNMENLQFCYISHDWNQEDPFATHQILTTSAHVTTMQSQHLVLGEPLYSNNITHATTDRLWSCFPLPELSNLK